jgi:predicted lipid-binding transport protein (Tim44 family)
MNMLNRLLMLAAVLYMTGAALAQAPVEERGQALQQGQYRAGVAHRELEQARFDAKLAEQDALNARDANTAAQKEAAARKRELDAAEKSLAAARARLQTAQRAYDDAVRAVDALPRTPPSAQNR